MLKITSLEPQKKNSKRFNIYLDGEFAFGADEDLVVDRRLVVGKVIDNTDFEKLLFEAEVGKLMERMYALFNIRQRSEKEVKDYLKRLSFKRKIKGEEEISDKAVELVVNKLKQKRLLSDEEFAKAWVEARRRSKQKGIKAIKAELYQKGINKEVIAEVLSQSDSVSEEELAKKAIEKKMRSWKNLPMQELKKKAFDFLMRRGFEFEISRKTIEMIFKKE